MPKINIFNLKPHPYSRYLSLRLIFSLKKLNYANEYKT